MLLKGDNIVNLDKDSADMEILSMATNTAADKAKIKVDNSDTFDMHMDHSLLVVEANQTETEDKCLDILEAVAGQDKLAIAVEQGKIGQASSVRPWQYCSITQVKSIDNHASFHG